MSERKVEHNYIETHTHYPHGGGGDTYITEPAAPPTTTLSATGGRARSEAHATGGHGYGGRAVASGNRVTIDNRMNGGMLAIAALTVFGGLCLALIAVALASIVVGAVGLALVLVGGRYYVQVQTAPHSARVEEARIYAQRDIALAMIEAQQAATYRPQLPPPPAQRLLTAGQVETVDGLFVEAPQHEYARR